MAGEEAVMIQQLTKQLGALQKLTTTTERAVAASLASGIIAARPQPCTVEKAIEILDDVYWTLYPATDHAGYNNWRSAKAMRDAAAKTV